MSIMQKRKIHKIKLFIVMILVLIFLLLLLLNKLFGVQKIYELEDIPSESLETYFFIENQSDIAWYYFAAMDALKGDLKKADNNEEYDKITSLYDVNQKNIDKALAQYKNKKYMNRVKKKLEQFKEIDIIYRNKRFPLPQGISYEYNNGWGDERTYGGERKHEGIDIVTDKGVPIFSVGQGIIENIGWNELGGWRIGIRGNDDIYYYYAHLYKYEEDMIEGKRINKGEVIGYVGSTGYGPEGTSGKFVDHLHFGMYKNDQAINPYPFLRGWEQGKDN